MQETDFLKGNQRVLNDIKKFEIFEPFQDDELHHLMSMSKIRKYSPGETIFEQGSADTWLYFLVYGKVRLMKDNKPVVQLQRRGDDDQRDRAAGHQHVGVESDRPQDRENDSGYPRGETRIETHRPS